MTPLGLANLMVDVAKNHMYWDCCRVCMDRGDMTPYPPEGVDEQKTRDGWFTFMYRCRAGRTWTCGYAAHVTIGEIGESNIGRQELDQHGLEVIKAMNGFANLRVTEETVKQ